MGEGPIARKERHMTDTTTGISLDRYATAGEARRARKLVRDALARGYCVSVNDGEETTVKLSRDFATITEALCTTGEDTLTMHRWIDQGEGMGFAASPVGGFWLIYGNDADGSELIADHTDNAACGELAA